MAIKEHKMFKNVINQNTTQFEMIKIKNLEARHDNKNVN
jgi:hypothetical protein